jgi:hypothetical protein
MPLINSFISWIIKKRLHQIELFMKYPADVQQELLRKLIMAGQDTWWGREYGYSGIDGYEKFKSRVPLSDYDSLKPLIDRLRAGEQFLLWNSEIRWFAKSSGTTSDRSKYIPVSQEALEECHYKGGKDVLSIYLNNFPDTNLFTGKGLTMGGSHQISEVNNESYYGDLSAILMQNLPYWAEFMRTPHLSIALMNEWEEKIERMAMVTKDHNVTNISGVPSWTLLLIKRILEITGKSDLSEVWPNLEVFFHGGVNFEPYREHYQRLIRKAPIHFMDTYNASEGFFGIQDRTSENDMLLMLDYGIFYEFIPMTAFNGLGSEAISLADVETGINYAVVISTNAGLWRYLIGDTVRFTSLKPHRIRITGRTRNFINAAGEELIIENAEQALRIACDKSQAIVNEYTAAPVHDKGTGQLAHQWLIEFEQAPHDISYFAETFDNALKSLNSDYEAKRYHNMVLKMPEIIRVEKGTFYAWLRMKGKLGGQHKVPRLSNNRDIVEEILGIIGHH